MWSVHAFVRQGSCTKQVPLALVLMSRRTCRDYKLVLEALLGALATPPPLEWIMMDFEAGELLFIFIDVQYMIFC